MKKIILILSMTFAFIGNVQGQTQIFYENFSSTVSGTQFTSWTRGRTDGTPIVLSATAPFAPVNNAFSSGYLGASGGTAVIISNGTISGTNEYVFSSTGISTTGFENITVNYGFRRTSSFTNTGAAAGTANFPLLEWSVDASNWNAVSPSLTEPTTVTSNWFLASAIGGFTLPSGVNNKANIYFRFRVTTNSTGTGNFRIDDFSVTGSNIASISSASSLTGFTLQGGYVANIAGSMINITVPFGTNLASLTATGVISANATINPAFSQSLNYGIAQNFTVTAENLSTTGIYTTNITTLAGSSANSITGFTIDGQSGATTISGNMIMINVPNGTSLTSLSISGISISAFATISSSTVGGIDFSTTKNFTVTSQIGGNSIYVVTVTQITTLSNENSITGFVIPNGQTTITGTTIGISMPFGTGLTALVPTISVSVVASVSGSGISTDFSNPVMYTVTAQSGMIKSYLVNVSVRPGSSLNSILGFSLVGQIGQTTITGNMIRVNVPFNTSLASLTLNGIALSQLATISPSTMGGIDFSSIKNFTVTSQIGNSSVFGVNVMKVPFSGIIETFTVFPTTTGWSIYTPKSTRNWSWTVSGNVLANGFGAQGTNAMESWLISPKLSFSGSQSVDFVGTFRFSDSGTPKPAQILYSTNYSGTGPISVAGWNVVEDIYSIVTMAGFKNFSATGAGYIAFKYTSSSPAAAGATSWTLDNISINGVTLFTPTVAGFVYNVEQNIVPTLTLSGITPLDYVRNSVSLATGNTTIPSNLTFTIAGQLVGKNIAANVGLSGGGQYSLIDATGAVTLRIPSTIFATLTPEIVEGNSVTVSGTIGQNNGLLQFTASKVHDVNRAINPRPTPIAVTTLNESTESKLVRVVAQIDPANWTATPSSANGFNVNATINGSAFIIRIYGAITDLYGKSFSTLFGDDTKIRTLTLIGLGGQFSNTSAPFSGYQIVPYSFNDFVLTAPAPPSTLAGFTSISIPALVTNGLLAEAVGTINGTNIDFVVPADVTVSGLLLFFNENTGAKVSELNGNSPQFLYNAATKTYTTSLVVTAQAGNIATYTITIRTEIPITSITKFAGSGSIILYPNPAQDLFIIKSTSSGNLEILSIEGKTILQQQFEFGTQTININTLAKGLYIVKIYNADGISTIKLIVN